MKSSTFNFIPPANGIKLPGLVQEDARQEKRQKPSKSSTFFNTLFSPFKHACHSIVKLKRRHSISLTVHIVCSSTHTFFTNLVNKISKIKNKIFFHKPTYFEKNKLFSAKERIDQTKNKWLLNLALMKDAAESPGVTEQEKKQIRFLAANFLCKTAPLPLNIMKKFFKEVASKHQINGLGRDDDHYHRFSLPKVIDIGAQANQHLAFGNKAPLILTDTIEFEHLLSLKFQVIDQKIPTKKSFELNTLKDHFTQGNPKKAFTQNLTKPYLFDLTNSLGQDIETQGDKDKEKAFRNHFNEYKTHVNRAIDEAVQDLIKDKPELAKYRSKLRQFIKENSTCICRVETESTTGIKVLPLYKKIKGVKVLEQHHTLTDFIIATGIGMGAVNLRKEMLSHLDDECKVQYCVKSSNSQTDFAFPNRRDVLRSALFQRMSHLFDCNIHNEGPSLGISEQFLQEKIEKLNNKPHVKLLGKATIDLFWFYSGSKR
jgi:hypothetical protein